MNTCMSSDAHSDKESARNDDPRRSNRVRSQEIVDSLNQATKNISIVHASALIKLNDQANRPSHERLNKLSDELAQEIGHVTAIHNELKKSLSDRTLSREVVKEMD